MTQTYWLLTDKGDPDALRIVDHGDDGKPHYSRQTPGSRQWTRNGENLVLIGRDRQAVWAWHRPSPGKASRQDGLDAWENAMFRRLQGCPVLASDLIREATEVAWAVWYWALGGPWPYDGLITFIKPAALRPPTGRYRKPARPGHCYLKAGWRLDGAAADGKPRLRAPPPSNEDRWDWQQWGWAVDSEGRNRVGRLREQLEGMAVRRGKQLMLPVVDRGWSVEEGLR